MKLLIICQYFFPEQFRVSDVSFKLAAMGHDVTVLTGLPNYPTGDIYDGYQWNILPKENFDSKIGAYTETINGVKVIRCNLYPRKTGKANLCRNYLSFLLNASKVVRRMIHHKMADYDQYLVFQFSPVTMAIPGIQLKKHLRRPLILYCFDLWPESIVAAGLPNKGLIYSCLLLLSRWIYKKADHILISSSSFRNYFKEKLKINHSISYLPIYAEDLFSQVQFKDIQISSVQNSVKPPEGINLVFAGNIGEMQSMETIIKAADIIKENDNIKFHIVGDGSAIDKSIALSNELSLPNITFHGRYPLEKMPEYYQMADAFLVTLKKDPFISYTLPGKVQSYMASAKPILAAIDGETYDTIQDAGCGLCCAAEDYEGLAKIILDFAQNKNSHRVYGNCSKAYYDAHFSEESFFNSLFKILSTK